MLASNRVRRCAKILLTRKIQRLGSSSLIITLPKAWVRKLGLLPGDNVYVIERDNQLVLIPFVQGEPYGPPVLFNVEGKSVENIIKEIRCLLKEGLRKIVVEDSRGLDEKLVQEISKAVGEFGGYTVEKTDATRVIVKGRPQEIDPGQNLREAMSRLADTIEVLTSSLTSGEKITGKPQPIEDLVRDKIIGWLYVNLDAIKGEILEERRRALPICLYESTWSILGSLQKELLSIINENELLAIEDEIRDPLLKFIKLAENALWESVGGISNDSEKRVSVAKKLIAESMSFLKNSSLSAKPLPLWAGRIVGAFSTALRIMENILSDSSCHILMLGLTEASE